MTRLSSRIEDLLAHYPIVIVGSGYGASIAASRLARAGQKVCVLERGREFQPGEYPNRSPEAIAEMQAHSSESPQIGSRIGLYDFNINPDINVFVGCGLGGTSLVNANVALRAEPRVFDDPRWPRELRNPLPVDRSVARNRDAPLEESYLLAEEMLKPTPFPYDSELPKLRALQDSAQHLGQLFYRPPISVNFTIEGTNHVGVEQHKCTACGDCITGCNYAAKNTLIMNYLPDARNYGAEIYTHVAVRWIERKGGRWLVHFEVLGPGGEEFRALEQTLSADMVILGAGVLGSTEILLRSKDRGLTVSDRVGERFTGNGDVLGFAYATNHEINGVGWGHHFPGEIPSVGASVTGIIDLRQQPRLDDGMVIEEISPPGALAAFLPARLAAEAGRVVKPQLSGKPNGPYQGVIRSTQMYLAMTHDEGAGRMLLENDRLRLRWPGIGDHPIFNNVDARLRAAAAVLGGEYVRNPIWSKLLHNSRSLISVHPLGGCVMAEDSATGAVNHKGQVFSSAQGASVYDSLYVMDGSVIPRPLGVNPLLTIAALAERSTALAARDRGWMIDYSLPSRAPVTPDFEGPYHPDRGHRELRQAVVEPLTPEPPPRHTDYKMYNETDGGERSGKLSPSAPLQVGRTYQLEVAVKTSEESIEGIKPEEQVPLIDPKQLVPVDILVTVVADGFLIPEPVQKLVLPPKGTSSLNACFRGISPERKTLSSNDLLVIEVRLFYKFNLLEVATIRAEAVGKMDHRDRSLLGLTEPVQLSKQRQQEFRGFDEVQPRHMHIHVGRRAGGFRLTFTFRKGAPSDDKLLEMSGTSNVPEAELESVVVAIRKALLGTAVSPSFGHKKGLRDTADFNREMNRLASLGGQLWNLIFRHAQTSALFEIGKWLQEHPLPRRSLIQISQDAAAASFVIPWNLLFDHLPPTQETLDAEADTDGFWGLRYRIEQLVPGVPRGLDEARIRTTTFKVAFLLWRFQEAAEQENFLNHLVQASAGQVEPIKLIDSVDGARQNFANCESHLLYFFAHGHTGLPDAARYGFSDRDFVDLYEHLSDGSPQKEAWKDAYNDMQDRRYRSDESWIKLQFGRLMLNELYGRDMQLRNKPLVFLNMCESAQVTPALSQSFIHVFMDRGACGVIGTECSIRSDFAHEFAKLVLEGLFAGRPVGEVILDTRLAFIQQSNPQALAYTLFGPATTRFEPPPVGKHTGAVAPPGGQM